ncbi:MAG: DNA methyltransferase, partial [Caldilinea sp.]
MSDMPLFRSTTSIETQYNPDAEIVLGTGDVNRFIQQIPDRSVTLVVTSPPYNLGKEYEDRVSIEHYLQEQSRLIAQLHRVLADDGNLCWQVGNFVENGEVYPLDVLYYPIFKELGMKLRNRIIWKFGHGLH